MTIWERVRDVLPNWRWSKQPSRSKTVPRPAESGDAHLEQARGSLRAMLDDEHVPDAVRAALSDEFAQVETMLDKIEHGHIHIAVFGRVGVGKSALVNALLGEPRFSSSPLHGETREAQSARWSRLDAGGVFLIDTPGINEVGGEERERLAHEVAGRSDLVLFLVEGDITELELSALRLLLEEDRPLLLVLNKSDRFSEQERALILESLRSRTAGLIPPEHIVECAAEPAERIYIEVDDAQNETETRRRPAAAVDALRERLWSILEKEGKTLAALNATLFAGRVSDTLTNRVMELRQDLADKVIRNYCLTQGVVVGVNPVPISDLIAATVVDVSLVVHLSRIFGTPMTRHEAGELIRTIGAQMALIVGTVWAVHFVSSALKAGTLGISTVVTAAAQGAVAYYSTYIVGQTAKRYFEQGKSWGELGPKRVVREILDSVDRDSLLSQARAEILLRLRAGQ